VLEETKLRLAVTMEEISKDKAAADIERNKVAGEEEVARAQEEAMLEAVMKVLKELKVGDLYVLKSLNTPTANVIKVM
jgi:hypothetical protein